MADARLRELERRTLGGEGWRETLAAGRRVGRWPLVVWSPGFFPFAGELPGGRAVDLDHLHAQALRLVATDHESPRRPSIYRENTQGWVYCWAAGLNRWVRGGRAHACMTALLVVDPEGRAVAEVERVFRGPAGAWKPRAYCIPSDLYAFEEKRETCHHYVDNEGPGPASSWCLARLVLTTNLCSYQLQRMHAAVLEAGGKPPLATTDNWRWPHWPTFDRLDQEASVSPPE